MSYYCDFLPTDKQIRKMLENKSISTLLKFIKRLFLLITKNQTILSSILQMSQQDQQNIKQFMTNGSLYVCCVQSESLIQSPTKQMKRQIQKNIVQLAKLQQSTQSLKDLLQNTQRKLNEKQKKEQQLQREVNKLKRSLQSYQEIDQLLKQKDDQIERLSRMLNELQVKNMRNQHTNRQLEKQLSNLKNINQQFHEDYENIKQQLEEVKQKWSISKKITQQLQLSIQKWGNSPCLKQQRAQPQIYSQLLLQNKKQILSQIYQPHGLLGKLNGYQTQRNSQRSYHHSERQQTLSEQFSVHEIQYKIKANDQDQKIVKNQPSKFCQSCTFRNTEILNKKQQKAFKDRINVVKKQKDNEIKLKNLEIQIMTTALVAILDFRSE